jgi:hypothetical protein
MNASVPATYSAHLNLLYLFVLVISAEGYKLRVVFLMQFFSILLLLLSLAMYFPFQTLSFSVLHLSKRLRTTPI